MALAVPQYAALVEQETTTTGTGTVDLGTIPAQRQGIVAAIGDASTGIFILLDGDGSGWQLFKGTVTDAATDTLSRDLTYANHLGTTADITLSGTTPHTVKLVWGPNRAQSSEVNYQAHIAMGPRPYGYNSSTVVDLDIRSIVINEEFFDATGTTTVTLSGAAADDVESLWARNNAGTLQFEFIDDATSYGVWDDDLGYFKKKNVSGGAEDADYRRIGYVNTDSSNNIKRFIATATGRNTVTYTLDGSYSDSIISGGSSTALSSLANIGAWESHIPIDASRCIFNLFVGWSAASSGQCAAGFTLTDTTYSGVSFFPYAIGYVGNNAGDLITGITQMDCPGHSGGTANEVYYAVLSNSDTRVVYRGAVLTV